MDRTQGIYSELELAAPEVRQEQQWKAVQTVTKAASFTGEFFRTPAHGWNHGNGYHLRTISAPFRSCARRHSPPSSASTDWTGYYPANLVNYHASTNLPVRSTIPKAIRPITGGWTEAFFAAGFRAGDLAQMTFSYHLTPAGLMLEEPLRTLGCAVIPAGPAPTVQLQLLQELPVTGFVGMTTFLKSLGYARPELVLT